MICDNPTNHTVKPERNLVFGLGNVSPTSPHDDERLGDHILSIGLIPASTEGICQQPALVSLVVPAKPCLGRLAQLASHTNPRRLQQGVCR